MREVSSSKFQVPSFSTPEPSRVAERLECAASPRFLYRWMLPREKRGDAAHSPARRDFARFACRRGGKCALTLGSEAFSQGFRVSTGMPNGKHANFVARNCEVNSVFEPWHSRLANGSRLVGIQFRVSFDAFKQRLEFYIEFMAQPWLAFLIPFKSLKVIQIGGRCEPHPLHFQPKRLRASARTCSHGTPACGFLRNSSARRSSSAICSGESSSSKSSPTTSRICSKASRCSSTGSFRNCSTTSIALMSPIYTTGSRRQAAVFHSALCTPHSSFP